LILKTAAAFAGYTLFAPIDSTTTYLIDLEGKLVHSWPSKYTPGQAVYLLPDGSLLRAGRAPRNRHFGGGGIGGLLERISPDGKLLWRFKYANRKHCQHHDFKAMPNGHVLLIAWEKKTREEAIDAGRDPGEMTGSELWPDCVIEVEPEDVSGGRIVWEWHVWDHLVQELDENKPNYGVVAEHPELVDLNYQRTAPEETPAELRRLRSIGYVGGRESEDSREKGEGAPPFWAGLAGPDLRADWCHTNAIDYNARLDQIALSVHSFNEIWIIDHSTSMKEAAGHRGGRHGKGGDLLYRWGNPRAYGAGSVKDQTLFAQHDVRWIPEGLPGSGHLTVFNNGPGRPDGPYSSVVEFAPPVDSSGHYLRERDKAFGPSKPNWEYTAAKPSEFFSSHISGAERLPNGNTLICSGEQGRIFEVDSAGQTVWEYLSPYMEHNGPGELFGPLAGLGRILAPPPGGPGPQDPRAGGATDNRPREGQRGPRPLPRGPGGPPGGPGGGLFRATRFAQDYPGIRRLLEMSQTKERAD
jgi:hypothetical protein